MNDDTWIWIVVAVLALALAALLVWFLARKRREQQQTSQLRERFGSEYDRRVEESGDERTARQHLSQVQERREQLDIRPLAPAARDRYLQRWQVVQSDFVDRPGQAVDEADRIVSDVMRERGYPVDDFDTRADMLAADHPQILEDYRQATDARRRHHDSQDTASTEELRRAMVHYRSLFEQLVGDPGQEARGDGHDRTDEGDHVDRTPQAAAQPIAPDDADGTHGRHAADPTPDGTLGDREGAGDRVVTDREGTAGHEGTADRDQTVDLRDHESRTEPRG